MNVLFLFPESGPLEALDDWVRMLGRYSSRHQVRLARTAAECRDSDGCVFVLTEMNSYPQERIDADIAALQGVRFGVVHNNDSCGWGFGRMMTGVPTPGRYPSFCWTETAKRNLESHKPTLLRQPVFSPIVPRYSEFRIPPLVGTFGHIETKKRTFGMACWAKKNGVPFRCVAPDSLAGSKKHLIEGLVGEGCDVQLHPWFETVEEIAPFVAPCSHFLFVLTGTKTGTGGSATSPRCAGLFNRPVIVVDDETTFSRDGYYVFRDLAEIKREHLADMKPPKYDWSPDAYLDALTERTMEFWRA